MLLRLLLKYFTNQIRSNCTNLILDIKLQVKRSGNTEFKKNIKVRSQMKQIILLT